MLFRSAAMLVEAVRAGTRYLLTDHDWDPRILARHESIMATGGAGAGAADTAGATGATAHARSSALAAGARLAEQSENGAADG